MATNGIKLHVVADGPAEGPLCILLHGFPEFWYGWRHQIGFLAEAGYRVWAPDQRGYNLSDKPAGIAAYNLDQLAADVVGLIDASGHERVFLVGHDWGAAVAWWVATKYPERLERLVILNVPHPVVLTRTLRRSVAQMRKSWYVFFFQIPYLPEALLQRQNWQAMARLLRGSGHRNTFSAADIERYREAWSQPRAFTSMLNWYRAIVQQPPKMPAHPRITTPTLVIWGVRDVALSQALAQPSVDLCVDGRLVFLEQATHWVQHDEPEQVNRLMAEFLKPNPHPK